MSNFIIYPYTADGDQITITSGGTLSGFPLDNLTDDNWFTSWKNDTANEVITLDIDLDALRKR